MRTHDFHYHAAGRCVPTPDASPVRAASNRNLFPKMETTQLAAMTIGIKAAGLVDDIVVFEGKILDGRARYLACLASGNTPRFREFDPAIEGDPIDFVVNKNLDRT